MNEFLEIFGLEYIEEDISKYDKYNERLKDETNKLRMELNANNMCDSYNIAAMFR